MVVLGHGGELYALRHTFGDDVTAWVEELDPTSLATVRRSSDLPAGPLWPGGLAVADGGDLHVVCGR